MITKGRAGRGPGGTRLAVAGSRARKGSGAGRPVRTSTPCWSSTSAPSTRSSSRAGSARRTSTPRSSRTPCRSAEMLAKHPAAMILSGGPASVYAEGAPRRRPAALRRRRAGARHLLRLPGHGARARRRGRPAPAPREFGGTTADVATGRLGCSSRPARRAVGVDVPRRLGARGAGRLRGHRAHRRRPRSPRSRTRAPAVRRPVPPRGDAHRRTASRCCATSCTTAPGSPPTWTTRQRHRRAGRADPRRRSAAAASICGLSGGVDSAVAAALVQRAVGDQLTCVFVDHGLLREGEPSRSSGTSSRPPGSGCKVVDAAGAVPRRARRGHRPRGEAQDHRPRVHPGLRAGRPRDRRRGRRARRGGRVPRPGHALPGRGRVRRRRRARPTSRATTTSAACPTTCSSQLVEPLRTLFKDEVRAVGARARPARRRSSGASRSPGPGLGDPHRRRGHRGAARRSLREADAIVREELTAAGLDREIWQCPVVLLADVRSVGVQGDGRTYGHPVVLRPVTSEDAMTADWARLPTTCWRGSRPGSPTRCREVNRVVLDVTCKPPGTIEWE